MKAQLGPGRQKHPFSSEEGGNVAIIFAVSFMPAIMMAGAALDYMKLSSAHSGLQHGVDAAALSVAANMTKDTTAARAQMQAQAWLRADPNLRAATITKVTISDDKQKFCASAGMGISGSFSKLMRIDTMNVAASACADVAGGVDPETTYELALVLDNSESMSRTTSTGESKMQALKTAAGSFVDSVFTKAPGKLSVSVVPFAGGVVAVDPAVSSSRTLSWIDLSGDNSQHWIAFGGKKAAQAAGFKSRFDIYTLMRQRNAQLDWRGCFEEPPYPRNVDADALTPGDKESLMVPYLAPDEPDSNSSYSNSYLNDNGRVSLTNVTCSDTASGEWNSLSRACKYRQTAPLSGNFGPNAYFGPNQFCPASSTQALLQSSADSPGVKRKIEGLQAEGNTNLHAGFMWGWRSIAPGLPFAGGRGYNAARNRKVMVFMTDGFNNWGAQYPTAVGSDYESLGYYTYNGVKNERLPNGTGGDKVDYQSLLAASVNKDQSYLSQSRKALDNLTLEACGKAKAAGVEVYTIGFSIPTDPIDAEGLALLKACATSEGHYFPASDAAQLSAAFKKIGLALAHLRLSN